MANLNKITLIGNIGKDAESKAVGERNVLSFTLAVSNKYKDKQGQQQTDTQWFELEYWCSSTGLLPYLTKGRTIYAEGEMRSRKYEDKQGQTRTVWFVRVNDIQLLGDGHKAEAAPEPQPVSQELNAAAAKITEAYAKAKTAPVSDGLPF